MRLSRFSTKQTLNFLRNFAANLFDCVANSKKRRTSKIHIINREGPGFKIVLDPRSTLQDGHKCAHFLRMLYKTQSKISFLFHIGWWVDLQYRTKVTWHSLFNVSYLVRNVSFGTLCICYWSAQKYTWVFHVYGVWFVHTVLLKTEVTRRFLIKFPNIKFHEQFVCVETEGGSDGQKVIAIPAGVPRWSMWTRLKKTQMNFCTYRYVQKLPVGLSKGRIWL
jgi:hypothetical protein